MIESARSMGMDGLCGRVRALTALLRGTLESGAREIDIRPISALPGRCEVDLLQNPIDDIYPFLTRGRKPAK